MSTKAEIWLNTNNDKDTFQIPVNPEEIKISYKGAATSIKVEGYGEIFHKGKRDAATVSFSSFFPAHEGSFCVYNGIPSPMECHKKIVKMMESDNPVHFVYCNSEKKDSINMYAYISSYTPQEKGGDPDTIHYTIELKEMRGIKLKVIKKGKVSTENIRPGNAETNEGHIIMKGETLYSIAKLVDKKNAKKIKKKIISLNKSTLSKWKKAYKKAKKKKKKKFIKDGKYKLLIGGTLILPK